MSETCQPASVAVANEGARVDVPECQPPAEAGYRRTCVVSVGPLDDEPGRALLMLEDHGTVSGAVLDKAGADRISAALAAVTRGHGVMADHQGGIPAAAPRCQAADPRQIRLLRALLMDSLRAASGVAARLSEATEGTDAMMLFEDARKAITAFAEEHPSMKALASAAVRDMMEGPNV